MDDQTTARRQTERTQPKPIERCPSCGGVINPQTGECRCSD
jgi:hypothetical protein